MLELAVLGALKDKPMSGYELKKELAEQLAHSRTFSYSALHVTLKKLSKSGAVEMQNPGAQGGRRKNVYRITSEGEVLFDRLLEESGPQAAEDRDSFMLRLSLFRYTKPETRRRLLERRRGYLLDQLERITGSLKNLRDRVDAYSLELMRYSESETNHDIRWLDTMLEAELRATMKSAERAERRARRKAERADRAGSPRTTMRNAAAVDTTTPSVAQ